MAPPTAPPGPPGPAQFRVCYTLALVPTQRWTGRFVSCNTLSPGPATEFSLRGASGLSALSRGGKAISLRGAQPGEMGPLCARLRGPHPQASCAGVDNICGFTVCFHFNVKQSWSSNMCMNKQNSSVEIAAEAGREEECALHLGPGGAVSAFEK